MHSSPALAGASYAQACSEALLLLRYEFPLFCLYVPPDFHNFPENLAVAGSFLVADSGVNVAPHEYHSSDQMQSAATETLQKSSMWQMALAGAAFQKPYGEPSGQAVNEKSPAEVQNERVPATPKAPDLTKFFKEPIISDLVLDAIPGRAEERAKAAELKEKTDAEASAEAQIKATITPEQREQYVAKLREHMSDYQTWTNLELAGFAVAGMGLLAIRSSKPVGLATAALGLGGTLYSSYRGSVDRTQAKAVLNMMPNVDKERFGQYANDVQTADQYIRRGYLISLNLTVASMLKLTPYINHNVSGLGAVAAVGNHAYQANFTVPRAISKFDAEVEPWRKELKKKG